MEIVSDFKNLDVNLPKYVYKYRSWDNNSHKRVLTQQELYLAAPNSFEDILDCNLEEQFPTGKKLYYFFIEKCKNTYPEMGRRERRIYAKYWSDNSPMANRTQRNLLLQDTKDLHDKIFGVLSLALRYNNSYMWEKYGNNHQGYCIGFDTSKLIETKLFGTGGYVKYDDKLPLIDFVDDDLNTKLEKNIFHKKKHPYEQEEEYRLAQTWDHVVSAQERVVHFPIECVAIIVIGKNAGKGTRKEICDIQQNIYPHAELVQL